MDFNNSNQLIWVNFAFIVAIVSYNIFLIDIVEGDPTIYLTFAKTFFDRPFSFGPDLEVSFGATSPIFLILVSIIHKIFGLKWFVFSFKLINFIFLYISAIFVIKIIEQININENIENKRRKIFSKENLLMFFFLQGFFLLFF